MRLNNNPSRQLSLISDKPTLFSLSLQQVFMNRDNWDPCYNISAVSNADYVAFRQDEISISFTHVWYQERRHIHVTEPSTRHLSSVSDREIYSSLEMATL